jgi:hypothetical protein
LVLLSLSLPLLHASVSSHSLPARWGGKGKKKEKRRKKKRRRRQRER